MSATLAPGFADPAIEAAAAFRAVLDILSRPGQGAALSAPAPEGLSPAAAAVLLTLADPDTPVWLAPGARAAGIMEWIIFHTGARAAASRAEAAFGIGGWDALLPLADWPAGTPDYPDRSATLIVEVPSLEGGPELRLSGPGIAGRTTTAPALPEGAAVLLRENAARYPLGLDLVLTAGGQAMGLPRSTRIGG